jgi:hypothetical protein
MFDLAGVVKHPTLSAQEYSPGGPKLPAVSQRIGSSDSDHCTRVSARNLNFPIYAQYAYRAHLARLRRIDEG